MPSPTVRLRMTLLYAGVFVLASAALLTVSYILVRNNLTADHVSVGSGPADELRRAIQREVADDALHRLRIQYVIALAAMIVFASAITSRDVYESCAEAGIRLVAEPALMDNAVDEFLRAFAPAMAIW